MEYGYIMVAGFSFKVKTILKGKSIKKFPEILIEYQSDFQHLSIRD